MRFSIFGAILALLVISGCGSRPLAAGTWLSGDGTIEIQVKGSKLDLESPDPRNRSRRIRVEGVPFTSDEYGVDAYRITLKRTDLIFRDLIVFPKRNLIHAYTHQNEKVPMKPKR